MFGRFEHIMFRAWQYVLMALVFVMPIEKKLAPPLLILLALTWALQGRWKERWQSTSGKFPLKLLLLLFMVYLAGLMYSENMHEGWKSVEGRLSFLLVSVVFLLSLPFGKKEYLALLVVFMAGCVFSAFYHLALSTYDYYHEIELVRQKKVYDTYINTNYFFASLLAHRHHPGYLSMYYLFAISAMLHVANKRQHYGLRTKHITWLLVSILLLAAMVFLLASKTGILLLMLIVFGFVLRYLFSGHSKKAAIAVLAICLVGVFAALQSNIIRSRFTYLLKDFSFDIGTINKTTTESNEVRLLVWDVALDLIKNKPLLGYGTGNAKTYQLHAYRQRGYTGVLEHQLNAHSQFFQTQLEVGLLGSLLLILLVISGVYMGFRQKNFLLLTLFVIYLVNMLIEAVFETQGGVVFFCIMLGILCNKKETGAPVGVTS